MSDPSIVLLANAVVEKKMNKLLNKLYEDKGIIGPLESVQRWRNIFCDRYDGEPVLY